MDFNGTVNKVILIGRLGDDVKMHYFDGGGCIGRFPLATEDGYTNRTTNEKVVTTEWHNIVMRNKAAETAEKYLSKGDKIYIEGRLKTRSWQSDNGEQRYATEVYVMEFAFLETKKSNTSNTTPPPPKPKTETPQKEKDDDGLPF